MTDNAISRVEAIAANEGQPLIQERGLVVEWRPDHPVDDDEYDRDYSTPQTALADGLSAPSHGTLMIPRFHT
jgi:hypothetical protein